MKKYFIANCGCDDHTDFIIELDDKELQTIIKFCDENNKVADYQCKPEIYVFEYEENKKCFYDYDDDKRLNKDFIELKKEV